MSLEVLFPFFDPKLVKTVTSTPTGSPEWIEALDMISDHIKGFETFLRESGVSSLEIKVKSKSFRFDVPPEATKSRLMMNVSNSFRPILELPITERLDAYHCFPDLRDEIERSRKVREESAKAANTNKGRLFSILRKAISEARDQILSGGAVQSVLKRLKELRQNAPTGNVNMKDRIQWFRDLAKVLLQLNFFDQVADSVKQEIPRVWNQLTFKQKLQVAAIGPIIGAGVFVGGVGLAGLGNAVGLPVIIVILVLLFFTNGLIDFLDYMIGFLSSAQEIDLSFSGLTSTFETVLSETLQEIFKRDYNIEGESAEANSTTDGFDYRKFEFEGVAFAAKQFGGKGTVTPVSRDGGIDGYIVNDEKKEVLLVQVKLYSKKIGFQEVTQYLGTLRFWEAELSDKFPYPIKGMVIVGRSDFSIEAKRVARCFSDCLFLLNC